MKKILTSMEQIRKNMQAMATESSAGQIAPGVMSLTMQEPIDSDAVEKVPTGIKGLDDVLHGGIHCGGYTVLASSEGTGKTTLTVQMVRGCVESGRKAFVISDEDGVERWNSQFLRMVIGPRWIDKSDITRSVPRIYPDAERFARAYYADWVTFASPYEMLDHSWKGILSTITEYAKAGYKLFVLDNLMVLTGLLGADPAYTGAKDIYQIQSQVCTDLRNIAKKFQIAVVLIQHKGKYKSQDENEMSTQDGSGTQDVGNAAMMYLHWVWYKKEKRDKINDATKKIIAARQGVKEEDINKKTTYDDTEYDARLRIADEIYARDMLKDDTDRRIICTKDRLYGNPFFRLTLHYDKDTLRYYHDYQDSEADSWEVVFQTLYVPQVYEQQFKRPLGDGYRISRAVARWIEEQKQEQERKEALENRPAPTGIRRFEGIANFLRKKLKLIAPSGLPFDDCYYPVDELPSFEDEDLVPLKTDKKEETGYETDA